MSIDRLGHAEEIDLTSFDLFKFRQMCILSGCDYLPSISGLGLKTAHKYFIKYKSIDRVLKAIKADYAHKMPKDYEERFRMAESTFMHQLVFDGSRLVHLNPIDAKGVDGCEWSSWDFLGPWMEDEISTRIAEGIIDPFTKLPFVKEPATLKVQQVEEKENEQIPFKITLDTAVKAAHRVTLKRAYSTAPSSSMNAQRIPLLPSTNSSRKFMYSTTIHSEKSFASLPSFFFQQRKTTAPVSLQNVMKKPKIKLDPSQKSILQYFPSKTKTNKS